MSKMKLLLKMMQQVVVLYFIIGSVLSDAQQNITKKELQTFTETLFDEDVNNVGRFIVISPQGRTDFHSKVDNAPLPLFSVDRRVEQISTISKLMKLYDNYDPDVRRSEVITASEKEEENEFLNAVLRTTIMSKTKLWLAEKGLAPRGDEAFKKFLHNLWFGIYSRQKQTMGSSAFEHIFLGEYKNSEVTGFHNWIFFNHQEKNKNLNYLGYIKKVDFPGNKGSILKLLYTWGGVSKPVGSMFIGTSPELEMSLYTVCFLVRPNSVCPVSLGGKAIGIQTYELNQKDIKYIGSAFPKL